MNEDQVKALLVLAMSYDNRKMPGQANVVAWVEASERGRWTFESAREAILAHYAEETAFIMPGHITARVRKQRAVLPPPQRMAIEAAPAEPRRIRSIIAGLAKELGWAKKSQPVVRTAPVQCPYCHSLPDKPCVRVIATGHRRGQHVPIENLHQSRVDLMKEL